jgi:hypothetical protein
VLSGKKKTKITVHQQLAALAGTWEGEELQRALQEPIAIRLKLD